MSIPFLQAAHYRKGRIKTIRLLIVHDMESPEKGSTAEACAEMFHTTTQQKSAHYACDSNSVVQCVRDEDTAFQAPPCNSDGLGIEHAGFASQKARDWADSYSTAMLRDVSAPLVARLCRIHGIPVRHLTNAQLAGGLAGIVGHLQVTQVYGVSTHTDPGVSFPWDAYIGWVKTAANPPTHQPPGDDVSAKDVWTQPLEPAPGEVDPRPREAGAILAAARRNSEAALKAVAAVDAKLDEVLALLKPPAV